MSAIKTFLEKRPNGPIYHYTDATAAINILENKKIWASNIRHLNDSAEFLKARSWINKKLKKWGKARRALASMDKVQVDPSDPLRGTVGQVAHRFVNSVAPVFVASFSEAANLLSQWRAYCPNGNGYSLGFDASRFNGSHLHMCLVKCVYKRSEIDELCTSLLESWAEKPEANDNEPLFDRLGECVTIMAAIKDESFIEEQEWRLVGIQGYGNRKFRSGRHGIVPYVEVPFGPDNQLHLTEAWIGPNSDMTAAMLAFRSLATLNGYEHLRLEESKIPFIR